MKKNYYEILEVDKKASPEIIKKAYNILAKKYHPDLQPENLKLMYEEKFKLINEAYETLSIPEKRAVYDSSLFESTISIEDYNIIYTENQKLRNIIQELENNITQNNYQSSNIAYNTHQDFDNINNEDNSPYDNYEQNFESNKNEDIYENVFQNHLKNVIAIFLTIIILFLLWQIPFIRKILKENILFNTAF